MIYSELRAKKKKRRGREGGMPVLLIYIICAREEGRML